MVNPNPPIPASPRPVWSIVGLLAIVALVVTPLAANVRSGSTEPVLVSSQAAPVADFASVDTAGDLSSLPWPTNAELEQMAIAERDARQARLAASAPAAPAPAPAPVAAPAPAPAAPAPPAVDGGAEPVVEAPPAPEVSADSVWDALAQCESSGNWAMNSGNGFYGGIQFMHSTWVNMGGRQWAEYPHEATREQQIEVATRLQAQYGWGQWPACSARLGLR